MKEFIKHLFKRFGLQVSRNSLEKDFLRNLAWHCQQRKVDVCFDVGANAGQFAVELREAGYQGQIVSFEPQRSVHEGLRRRAASDPFWTVAPAMAIGNRSGEIEINIANNSFSSSVLPMLESHLEAAPHSRYVDRQKVPIETLDGFLAASPDLRKYQRPLLKVDTQGFEGAVLEGAPQTLAYAQLVVLEMSMVPLYEGSRSFIELFRILEIHGFRCVNLDPLFYDKSKHELLQVDGLFARA